MMLPRVLLAVGAAAALAGCAAGSGWPALLATLLWSASLVLAAGCSSSHGRDRPRVDAGEDGGGTWERCCNGGVIDTCYCPPMTACNYGWFTDCGDGTCSVGGSCGGEGGVDAGPTDAGTDAGGYWEPCCVDGVVDTCFCPAGVACNYGWFTYCSEDACAYTPDECPPDGGVPDGGEDGSVTVLDAGAGI